MLHQFDHFSVSEAIQRAILVEHNHAQTLINVWGMLDHAPQLPPMTPSRRQTATLPLLLARATTIDTPKQRQQRHDQHDQMLSAVIHVENVFTYRQHVLMDGVVYLLLIKSL